MAFTMILGKNKYLEMPACADEGNVPKHYSSRHSVVKNSSLDRRGGQFQRKNSIIVACSDVLQSQAYRIRILPVSQSSESSTLMVKS